MDFWGRGPRRPPAAVVDALVVAVVGGLAATDMAVGHPGYRESDPLSWLLLAVSLAALLQRRRRPVPVLLVTGAVCAAWALLGHIGELLNLPVIVALYTVAVYGNRRRTLVTGVVAAVLSGIVALSIGSRANPQGVPLLEMVWPLVPLLLGEVVRTRGQLLREYADRAVHAERDREREAERRVREERVRIARELHDIVAHTVSGMTVQAGLALDALDREPETARTAMRQVRASGKEAVRELRTTLAVLREGPDAARTAPAPRLADLPELAARVGADGVEVTLERSPREDGENGENGENGEERGGGPGPVSASVSASVQLAAYRIVQEALTNVVRHSAARAATVAVRAGRRLVVEVTDAGPPGPAAEGAGFGLIGMGERAAAVGGTLTYGPLPGGGFRVRAELPLDGSASKVRGAAGSTAVRPAEAP